MDKERFIEEISKELGYEKEKCLIICDVLENHFLIGKNNKNKIITDLSSKLEITNTEAEKIYEVSSRIIGKEIKHKIFHPFGSSK